MRLALHGGLFSGKSTLAAALQARGFSYVNYTRYLKVLAARSLSAIGIPTTVEMIEADKEAYRDYLIALGSRCGFDRGNFVEQALIEQASAPDYRAEYAGGVALAENIVFDNVRFDAQFKRLIPHGFRLVRLTTPPDLRLGRALAKGLTHAEFRKRMNDPSETPLSGFLGEVPLSVEGDMDQVIDTLTAKLTTIQWLETPAGHAADRRAQEHQQYQEYLANLDDERAS